MGMFDSVYDAAGNEWQTKAFDRLLREYRVGDDVPGPPIDFQFEVYGGPLGAARPADSYGTVRAGVLVEVPAERDRSLLLVDYRGHWAQGA